MKFKMSNGRTLDVKFHFQRRLERLPDFGATKRTQKVPYGTVCEIVELDDLGQKRHNLTKCAINKHPIKVLTIYTFHDGTEIIHDKTVKEQFNKRSGRLFSFRKQIPILKSWGYNKDDIRLLFNLLFKEMKS